MLRSPTFAFLRLLSRSSSCNSKQKNLLGSAVVPLSDLTSGPTPDGKFAVVVGLDRVILDNPTAPNKDGWTPLHACCHSFTTTQAALLLIDHLVACNADLNAKTTAGPGAFSAEWTPLHMACAYGLESVAVKLCEMGADVNCRNTQDMTPLLETAYRGYHHIAKTLISHGASISYLPSTSKFRGAPFCRPHPQTPLGEAARCGFPELCSTLVSSGAKVDEENKTGWTPLHEACYTNQFSCVKFLLTEGADATKKNDSGALPYQLAVTSSIRDYIREHGGEGSIPDIDDQAPFFFGSALSQFSFKFLDEDDDDEDKERGEDNAKGKKDDESQNDGGDADENGNNNDSDVNNSIDSDDGDGNGNGGSSDEDVEEVELINRGGLLGDLPVLHATPQKVKKSKKKKKKNRRKDKDEANRQKEQRAVDKYEDIPTVDVPQKFKCQITNKIMRKAVQSPAGHFFDHDNIVAWFKRQGSICPITGTPLNKRELVKNREVRAEIVHWVENYRAAAAQTAVIKEEADSGKSENEVKSTVDSSATDRDMYDF